MSFSSTGESEPSVFLHGYLTNKSAYELLLCTPSLGNAETSKALFLFPSSRLLFEHSLALFHLTCPAFACIRQTTSEVCKTFGLIKGCRRHHNAGKTHTLLIRKYFLPDAGKKESNRCCSPLITSTKKT